jgi:hypothetical protein
MAKTKGKQGKKSKGNKKVRSIVRVPRPMLDGPAIEYAKLLANPCTGPLVPGPFGDGTGGIISRFEVDQVIDTGSTSVGSFVGFVPSSLAFYTAATAITGDAVAFSPYQIGTKNAGPGSTFCVANSGTYRVLSACLQLYYPGTELTRAGIVGVGQANVGSLSSAAITLSSARTLANFVERVPVDMVELVWRPNSWDLEWTNLASIDAETSSNFNRRSTIFASTFGIPVSTGMRVRMVSVVEWIPATATGQPSNIVVKNSNNSYTEVLNWLDSFGEWAYKGAMHVSKTAASLYSGARAVSSVAYGVGKMAALTMG